MHGGGELEAVARSDAVDDALQFLASSIFCVLKSIIEKSSSTHRKIGTPDIW